MTDAELFGMSEAEFDAAVDRDAANHPPHPDDDGLCMWPDGTYCDRSELPEYLAFMSDDYEVL